MENQLAMAWNLGLYRGYTDWFVRSEDAWLWGCRPWQSLMHGSRRGLQFPVSFFNVGFWFGTWPL